MTKSNPMTDYKIDYEYVWILFGSQNTLNGRVICLETDGGGEISYTPESGISYTPEKGQVPNRFVRFMMRICFDCYWVKEDD